MRNNGKYIKDTDGNILHVFRKTNDVMEAMNDADNLRTSLLILKVILHTVVFALITGVAAMFVFTAWDVGYKVVLTLVAAMFNFKAYRLLTVIRCTRVEKEMDEEGTFYIGYVIDEEESE